MSTAAISQHPQSEQWLNVLDGIATRLDHALRAAELRSSHLPAAEKTPIAEAHRAELSGIAERIQGLQAQTARSQAIADDEDLMLGVNEDALRRRQAEVAALRQRLAAGSGRAIL